MIKKVSLFLLFALAFYKLGERFCEEKTAGFTISKISFSLPYDARWETTLPEFSSGLLDQKYTFLGSGGQSFAFVSEDGKNVLKFLKYPFRLSTKKKERLERDYKSYQLAFEELKEESGLIYLHLTHSPATHKTVTLIDRLGIEHRVILDEKAFILQHKAELLYPYIEQLMQKGDLEGAKAALHSLVHLLDRRCKKGIFDEDAKIHRNCGFINGKAIFIDIGRFKKSEKTQSLEKITNRFRNWLLQNYPELVDLLDYEIQSI
jgi:hypothetical protein